MSDLISRQAAIDALNDEFTIIGKTNAIVVQDYIRRVNNRLHDLPSAQPEQKIGRWIRMYYSRPKQYTRICSECGEICWFCGIGDYNYCPWCGARMKGEEDDRTMPL